MGARPQARTGLMDAASSVIWPYVLGFALAQTWTVLCIALPDPITYGEPFLDLRWVSLTTAGCLSLAAALHARFGAFMAHSRAAFAVVGVVASASSLLGPVSALFSAEVSSVLLYLAAVGVGAGFAWLYIVWYTQFCVERDMLGLAASVVASMGLTYPLANVLATDQMSPWISALLGSLLPMASVLCAHIGGMQAPHREPARAPLGAQACGTPVLDRSKQLVCLRFCICLFIVVAVFESTRNFLLGGTAIAFYAGVANLGGVALKIACALWLVGVFVGRSARGVSAAYRVALMLLLGVVLCIPLMLQGNWFAHMMLDVGAFFFQMVVLMVAYQITVGFCIEPQRFFGLARALWALGSLGGIGIELLRGVYGAQFMQLLPIVLGLAAAVAFLFVFTDHDCVEVLASMPAHDAPAPAPTLEAKARALALAHGVSDRELEVALLVAKGRSSSRIAQMLGVSLATVNSHVHHVYQKLDVHSRQELIDAIENVKL